MVLLWWWWLCWWWWGATKRDKISVWPLKPDTSLLYKLTLFTSFLHTHTHTSIYKYTRSWLQHISIVVPPMSQTTKRRSIRFGKEGPATSIRTGSKSTSDLRQLSLNSFLKTHDSLSMPATASSRRVTDHSPSQKKVAPPKTTPASPTPDHSQLLKGVVACLDIRFVSCATSRRVFALLTCFITLFLGQKMGMMSLRTLNEHYSLWVPR